MVTEHKGDWAWSADPKGLVMMRFDPTGATYGYKAIAADRHNGGMNCCFLDGHAQWYLKDGEIGAKDNRLWSLIKGR